MSIWKADMAVVYEWCAERMCGEDIIDRRHATSLKDIWPLDDDEVLVLVRDVGNDVEGLQDRMWAYAMDNMLPAEFEYCDGGGGNGTRVPKRFHREIAKTVTTGC